MNKGDIDGAKKGFLETLDEAAMSTVAGVKSEIKVAAFSNLGMLARRENNFTEALKWYKNAEEEQMMAGGNWVKDITETRKKMQQTVAMLSGGQGD